MKSLSAGIAGRVVPLVYNAYRRQRLSVLIYHRVLPQRDPMRAAEPTTAEFDTQMRILREYFHPLPLLEAVARLGAGSLPDGAVCVTFDDGYADNEIHAMPVLKKYAIPATVFVSTGFLNGGRMWNDSVIEVLRSCSGEVLDLRELDLDRYSIGTIEQRVAAAESILQQIKHLDPQDRLALVREIEKHSEKLPNDMMMTDAQVQSLAHNGIAIGAHTVNHPILTSIDSDHAFREIQESKQSLEALLQTSVDAFAYPNGRPELDYSSRHRDMVSKLGFKAAVSTHWGVGTRESDQYQLPRFTPWDRHPVKFAVRLLANYRNIDPLIAAAG